MSDEEPLRQRYLRRFRIGIVLLALLAVPAIFHSYAAINSLFNRPADWVPDSLDEKKEFNDFIKHFSVSELLMVGWEESDLDSPSLAQAAEILGPLCEANYDAETDEATLSELPNSLGPWIQEIRNACGSPTPLRWVRSGTETLHQLTSAPANLPRGAAIGRLQGSLIGEDGEQTCLLISFGEPGLEQRRMLIPAIREMIGGLVQRDWSEIAAVGGPFEGATVDSEAIRSIRVFSPPSAFVAALLVSDLPAIDSAYRLDRCHRGDRRRAWCWQLSTTPAHP